MNESVQDIIGVSIPVVAIVLGMSIGALSLWLDFRKKKELFELHHRERMTALDKGIEVPPLPPEFFAATSRRSCRDPLRTGLVWTFLGVAVCVAVYGQDKDSWTWGLLPTAYGLANLVYLAARRGKPASLDDPRG